jgi:hypothetical protein
MKFEIHFEFRASLRKFQNLNFWDATKPHSGSLAIHLGSVYESDQPRLDGIHGLLVKSYHLCRV